MKVLIVEDNEAIRHTLMSMLKASFPEIDTITEARGVDDGAQAFLTTQPDIAFLDVEIVGGSSFDLLAKLPNVEAHLIFTTAHEKYALQAIKFSALDFLLKPVNEAELILAFNKAKEEINKKDISKKVEVLLQNLNGQKSAPDRIVINDKYGIEIVETKNIIRLEASGGYTTIHTTETSPITISQGLKFYEQMLTSTWFFRSHHSHIVNINFLQRYDKKEGDFLILKDGAQIPLAVRRRDQFLELLKSI